MIKGTIPTNLAKVVAALSLSAVGFVALEVAATPASASIPQPSGAGSFVIGDQSAVQGATVTFWGAQWTSQDSLSGGAAPPSFKGYADSTPVPTCGTTWSTRPGNSSGPPISVGADIEVIVTSSVVKNGSTISGNTVGIVIVQTNPGYADDPGHPGTGTVVSVSPCDEE